MFIPTNLIYFGLGVLFIESIPLLEGVISLIAQILAMLQGYIAIIITKQSAKIAKIKEDAMNPTSSVRTIGFGIPDDDYEDDESEAD